MPVVSVIMPVYNSEKYLPDAIESVLGQTFPDFELILVDDGSPDGSGEVCDAYAARDARVRVIHRENGGISAARNTGIDAATGEYIAFIDNDDKYCPDLLEAAVGAAREEGADVVKFGYHVEETFPDGSVSVRDIVSPKRFIVSDRNRAECYSDANESGFLNTVWNGIYSRNLLVGQGLKFDAAVKYGLEDRIMDIGIYGCMRRAAVLNKIYYLHEQRERHSTSKLFRLERVYDYVKLTHAEYSLCEKIRLRETRPGLWETLLIKKTIDMLLEFQFTGCELSKKERVSVLRDIAGKEPFSSIALPAPGCLDRKKRLVWRLFAKRRFGALLALSNGYGKVILYKKTHTAPGSGSGKER